MKFRRILFIGVFVLAISSAFASKMSTELEVSFYNPYVGYCSNAGVLSVDPSMCEPYWSGAQCTVMAYTPNGVEEFPAYCYVGHVPTCVTPLNMYW